MSLNGSDSEVVWTRETWTLMRATLNNLPILGSAALYALAVRLNYIRRYSEGIPIRSIPEAYYLQWCPGHTVAEAKDLIEKLLANTAGLVWLAKVDLPWVKITGDMLCKPCPVMSVNMYANNEWPFEYVEYPISYVAAGPAQAWLDPPADPEGGEDIYDTVYYFKRGTSPTFLYGLKALFNKYTATYNPLGCLEAIQPAAPAMNVGDAYILGISLADNDGTTIPEWQTMTKSSTLLHIWGVMMYGAEAEWTGNNLLGSAKINATLELECYLHKTVGAPFWDRAVQNTMAMIIAKYQSIVRKSTVEQRIKEAME